MARKEIQSKQLHLPVSFRLESETTVTLEELLQEEKPAAQNLSQLTPEHRLALAHKRISMLPDFTVSLVGLGELDQSRALTELEQRTEVGQLLAEVEYRTIRRILHRAAREDLT